MPNSTSGASARVMIVDDHPHTASMLARALGQFSQPVEILTARSGQEALDQIRGGPVDVLITDFMMSQMNGLELIEQLQVSDVSAPRHIILITAYDSPGLALTARRLKVNDYLVKPVQPDRVREIVAHVVDGVRPYRQPEPEPVPAVQYKLLIADDRPENVRLLARHLEHEGYHFVTAGDGEEALQRCRSEMPDLVLLDVNMPKKNGFEVLADIREDPGLAHIPVVMITAARVEPRDVRTGLGLGADDYITKPFDWRELAARIRTKLKVKQAEDALRRRNRELNLLPEIGQELSARLDVDDLARVVLERTVATLGASSGHVAIFHPDGGVLHKVHAAREYAQRAQEVMQQRIVAEGLMAYVVAARKGTIVEDTQTDARWLKTPNDPVRSAAAVPLLGRRAVIGVLTLHHEQPGYFNVEHLALLQAIASQAAIGVENAQLYAVELKRVNELVALNRLTRELSLFTRSADLFERLPHIIRDNLGYPTVTLWLNGSGGPQLRSVAGAEAGPPASYWAEAPRQVAAGGRSAIIAGSVDDLVVAPAGRSQLSPSAAAVPLFWEAGVSGVLAVHAPRPNAFQESDRVLLETLAAQVASAMERIRLFETVEQEQRRLAAVLSAAAGAMLVLECDGRLRLANPAARELFAGDELRAGQPLPAGRGYDGLITLLRPTGQAQGPRQAQIEWPDGRIFTVLVSPVEEGGLVTVLHDVSYFKDLERVKNEFIATASHDLKSPITAMLGYGDLLAKAGPLNERQAAFADRMHKAAVQMRDLVSNLLELARIDLDVALRPEPCEMLDLLTGATDEFRPHAEAKGQALALLPPDMPLRINGDPTRLRQALRNLIGNAVKYTPSGGQITLTAEAEEGFVCVHVQDNGPGIAAADLPHLFEKFYRAHATEAGELEGSGLGLAIVKAIVEQHGGEVSVTSAPGQGSCFSFTLPLRSYTGRNPAPSLLSAAGDSKLALRVPPFVV
jgi:signal transduction histidine kinase/CheY-like chemotaxis protein